MFDLSRLVSRGRLILRRYSAEEARKKWDFGPAEKAEDLFVELGDSGSEQLGWQMRVERIDADFIRCIKQRHGLWDRVFNDSGLRMID